MDPSHIPLATLSYIQYGIHIYAPNASTNTLLDSSLINSHLATTLDHTIDPESPLGFL